MSVRIAAVDGRCPCRLCQYPAPKMRLRSERAHDTGLFPRATRHRRKRSRAT